MDVQLRIMHLKYSPCILKGELRYANMFLILWYVPYLCLIHTHREFSVSPPKHAELQ